jgi:hypothetical protein
MKLWSQEGMIVDDVYEAQIPRRSITQNKAILNHDSGIRNVASDIKSYPSLNEKAQA